MKKLLFAAYTLDIGGIEKALISLLEALCKNHEITLVLEKKQGVFLKELNKKITIIEYKPSQHKNKLIRKIVNLSKRIKFVLKYKNKFDFSASFATYSKMGSFCARIASKNNALWVHTDYLAFYNQNEKKVIEFFKLIKYNKFKRVIVVSNKAKQNLNKVLKIEENKLFVIRNLLDYEKTIKMSNEKINLEKEDNIITFLNVARHEEECKKISRLILAAEKLKTEQENFRIILIGEGKDTSKYKEMVQAKKLNENILFLGYKENPYPYFRISNCFILTSEYEGYPLVFNEAKLLGLPIITTDVSDSKEDVDEDFGKVVLKTDNSIYLAMKDFIKNGYKLKAKFNAKEFNGQILRSIEEIV